LESTLITSNALTQGGAASSISSKVRNLLQTANQVSNNVTMLKTAVLQKVIAAADQAPLGVEALSHSFLQTITPLCSAGDLGNRPSSLDACVSLYSRTSQTLLGKPIASDASNNILNTAAGILASFAVNVSQTPGISSILNTNDAMLQIQNILNVTMATVYNMAKQAYLGYEPLSLTTRFSRHVASRTKLASLNGTVSFPGMASISFAPNLAAHILGSESNGFIQPISVIAESYNSSVIWASINKSFVSGVHGLSFHTDSGPVVVKDLPINCSINISIPLDSNEFPPQQATSSNYRCNYWDPASVGWKQDGCRVIQATQTHVIVSTSHLAQFRIEFQPSPPTSTALPATTSSTTTTLPTTHAPFPPTAQVPNVVLTPPFSRLGSMIVTVSTSSANFDRFNSMCSIVFGDKSSVSVNTTFESSTTIKCFVPASTGGRTVNISVSGIVMVDVGCWW